MSNIYSTPLPMKPFFYACLLLALLLNCSSALLAQHKYIPFPDSNAIWVIRFIGEHGEDEGASQTFIQKDTMINGIDYKKMVETSDSNLITPPGSHELWYAIRNDTAARKVYIYDILNGGGGKEKILYDFSVNIGDTIPNNSWWTYRGSVITDIDTIVIDTNEHLVFYTRSKLGDNLMPYIEGIGGTAGLIYVPVFFEGGTQLVCQMLGEDRQPYYTAPGEICKLYHYTGVEENAGKDAGAFIYPHPVNAGSILEIKKEGDLIDDLLIYDNMGRLIYQRENTNNNQVLIGPLIHHPGIYYYWLTTRKGNVHSGKFVY